MLVLSRKVGESIVIAGNITITVTGLEKGRVRLGIVAPKDTAILRDDAKEKEPRDASRQ